MSFTTCNLCSEHSTMASKGTLSRMIDLNCDSKWSFANQARLLLSKMLCINFIQCITLPLGTFRLPNAECLCENDFRCKNNCSSQTTSFVVWNSTLLHWIQSSSCMMIRGKSKSFNVRLMQLWGWTGLCQHMSDWCSSYAVHVQRALHWLGQEFLCIKWTVVVTIIENGVLNHWWIWLNNLSLFISPINMVAIDRETYIQDSR